MRFTTLVSIALFALTATAMPLAARTDANGVLPGQGDVSKDAGKVESTVNGAGKSVHGLRLRNAVTPPNAGNVVGQVKSEADKTVGGAGKVTPGNGKLPKRGGDVTNGVLDKAKGAAKGEVGDASGKAKGENTLLGST